MKTKAIILATLLLGCQVLPAQNYYMQYTHDTLGNRTNRVRGILTREMEAVGMSSDTVLQDIIITDNSSPAFTDIERDGQYSDKYGLLVKTRAEKDAFLREMTAMTARLNPIKTEKEAARTSNTYDVGAISLQYGVSQTGARTYSIPILTAQDIKYAPSLAMVYNSQGGYGYGGYGWDLAGLSAITLTGRSLYYDDMIKAADAADTSAVFMLDGVRLVRNDDPATSANYPLVTATGHILAAPVKNTTAGGNTIQDLRTTFNPQTGNLTNRSNAANSSSTEYFYYDALGRLNYDSQGPSAYDIKGNAIYRSGIGTMTYPNASHPYRLVRLNASSSSVTRPNPQTATYTAYDRPATLAENYLTASFTYNADYQRVKMQTTVQGNIVQKKYYIGGRYEREENSSGTVTAERLFVGGDAYSAPMVLQRTSSSGSWTPYVIGRDYLGSITNIVTTSGTSVATYSYDPWGRMRDPQSLTPYSSTSQPSLLLGRGFCGHEHLSNYGLINMNARLYDPVLGRFLSPDPYVQSPDFSQNFNRYAYALNNPLKYTDESGEYTGIDDLLAALIGGTINWATNGCQFTWAGLSYFAIGATSGVASLYLSPVVASGFTGAANSIVKQGFGNDGKWDGKRISLDAVLFDGAMSAAFSYAGSALSSFFTPFFGKLTSGISGRAWSEMISQGLTGGATGFVTGFAASAMTQYRNNEDNIVSWKDALRSGGEAALMGLTVGSISGMAQGVRDAYAAKENPWALTEEQLNPLEIDVQYPSLGAKSRPFSARKLSDTYLKNMGFDPHSIKYEYLGKIATIKLYDIYKAKDGQLIIYGKNGVGEGIPTRFNINFKP